MLRGCSSRSVTGLLSRVLGTCQSPALVAGRQHFRTSIKPPSSQQAFASADGRVCQQQQLLKLARQVTCSATAAAMLPVGQSMENIMVCAVLDRILLCLLPSEARLTSPASLPLPLLSLQLPLQLGFAARFSSSAGQQAAAEKQPAQQQGAKKEVSGPSEPAPPRQQGVCVHTADVTPSAGCLCPRRLTPWS